MLVVTVVAQARDEDAQGSDADNVASTAVVDHTE
jgi:hypothetical protein